MMEKTLKLQVESGSKLPNPHAVISIKGEDILVKDVINFLKEKYGPDISEVILDDV